MADPLRWERLVFLIAEDVQRYDAIRACRRIEGIVQDEVEAVLALSPAPAPAPAPEGEPPHSADCKCLGAGWVWGHELDDPDPDTLADTMTRYPCDAPAPAAAPRETRTESQQPSEALPPRHSPDESAPVKLDGIRAPEPALCRCGHAREVHRPSYQNNKLLYATTCWERLPWRPTPEEWTVYCECKEYVPAQEWMDDLISPPAGSLAAAMELVGCERCGTLVSPANKTTHCAATYCTADCEDDEHDYGPARSVAGGDDGAGGGDRGTPLPRGTVDLPTEAIEPLTSRQHVRAGFARREREGKIGMCEGAAVAMWDEAEKDAAQLRAQLEAALRRGAAESDAGIAYRDPARARALGIIPRTTAGQLADGSADATEAPPAELLKSEASPVAASPSPAPRPDTGGEERCPGPDCPLCSGEACDLCLPGPGRPACNHDVLDRHRRAPSPAAAPREDDRDG